MNEWVFLLLLGLLGVSSHEQRPVPVSREPDHHLKFENAFVRAYDVVVPPGGATLMHVHSLDYFFINFLDATLKSTTAGQAEQDLLLKKGEVRFTPATLTQQIRNVGRTPFHNLTVELLGTPAATPEASPPAVDNQRVLLEDGRIRAIEVSIGPGESTGMHTHSTHTLLVAVDDGMLRSDTPSHKGEAARVRASQFAWYDAPLSHSLANDGDSILRLIEVEIK